MNVRDRIKELRRVRASELRPHPRNWRRHPQAQQDTLRGVLAEIGYADALLARELPDGSLQLLDGHLRAETTPDAEVPVLIVDLDDQEAAKLLAVLDPLAALAVPDFGLLTDLLADVKTDSPAVRALFDGLLAQPVPTPEEEPDEELGRKPPEVKIPEAFQVVVECRSEEEQRELFERLTREGFACRLLNL